MKKKKKIVKKTKLKIKKVLLVSAGILVVFLIFGFITKTIYATQVMHDYIHFAPEGYEDLYPFMSLAQIDKNRYKMECVYDSNEAKKNASFDYMIGKVYSVKSLKRDDDMEIELDYNNLEGLYAFPGIKSALSCIYSSLIEYKYNHYSVKAFELINGLRIRNLISQYGDVFELKKAVRDGKVLAIYMIWKKGKVDAEYRYPIYARESKDKFHHTLITSALTICNLDFVPLKDMGHYEICNDGDKEKYFKPFLNGKGKIELK